MTSEAARVAANWWGDAVCGNARHDTDNGMLNMIGRIAAAREPSPATSVLDRFVSALETGIAARVEKCGEVGLRVDYHPEGLLLDALNALDRESVRGFSFPPKTSMTVTANDVTVSNGYRAPTERLFGAPNWRVTLYTADYDRFDPYHGSDETAARVLHAMGKAEAAAFPKAKAILSCDGNDMAGDD